MSFPLSGALSVARLGMVGEGILLVGGGVVPLDDERVVLVDGGGVVLADEERVLLVDGGVDAERVVLLECGGIGLVDEGMGLVDEGVVCGDCVLVIVSPFDCFSSCDSFLQFSFGPTFGLLFDPFSFSVAPIPLFPSLGSVSSGSLSLELLSLK